MSVSGLKAELKFLESIFDKDHERFRIVSWKLDELHCQFVLLPPPPGSSPQPPPPLTIHCNITVRGPRGAGRAGHGPPSPLSAGRGEGAQPRWGDSARGGRSSGAPGALPAATITKVTGAGGPGLSSCAAGAPPEDPGTGEGRGPGPPPLWGRQPRAGTKGGRARGSGHRAPGRRREGAEGPRCPARPCGGSRVAGSAVRGARSRRRAGALPSAPHGRGLGRARPPPRGSPGRPQPRETCRCRRRGGVRQSPRSAAEGPLYHNGAFKLVRAASSRVRAEGLLPAEGFEGSPFCGCYFPLNSFGLIFLI